MMRKPSPPVDRALRRLGQNISLARRRRHMSQGDLAVRIDASASTVRRMEEGNPGTALQHFARVMQVFGELGKLEALLDSSQDEIGLSFADEKLPKRIRARSKAPQGF